MPEIDKLCDYLTQTRGLGTDSRSQELARNCRRSQLTAMNERRLMCTQRSVSREALAGGTIDACVRRGQSFAQALEDKTDFDRFDRIGTLAEFSQLSRRLSASNDRLGLLGEIGVRMDELCAQSPPAFTSREGWANALELYQQAGTSGACGHNAALARQALLASDQAQQRAALAAALSWKQLEGFIEQYAQRDVAGLLVTARERRDNARRDEIGRMRAMPLADLERFWRNDSDLMPEMKSLAYKRLLEDSLAEATFAGALRAYRVSGNLTHIRANQALARTPDDRRRLEEIAVGHASTPGRFFRVGITAHHGQPSRDEITHAGYFALYTMTGSVPIQGVITVQRATDAPGPLALGQYRVHVEAVLKTRLSQERSSGMLGSGSTVSDETVVRRVSVLVSAPTMSGSASVDFGALTAVRLKRGSAEGYEKAWISEEPVIQVTVVGVDVISGDSK